MLKYSFGIALAGILLLLAVTSLADPLLAYLPAPVPPRKWPDERSAWASGVRSECTVCMRGDEKPSCSIRRIAYLGRPRISAACS